MQHLVRIGHPVPLVFDVTIDADSLAFVRREKQTFFLALLALILAFLRDLRHVDAKLTKFGQFFASLFVYDLQAFEAVDLGPELSLSLLSNQAIQLRFEVHFSLVSVCNISAVDSSRVNLLLSTRLLQS